ncbi:hypothetical protein BJV78DRAFT_1212016 [Lactifluus subvellereus]|nr:hypothetical protein BJV78DRAFT_1212016 [Lactifluus subvellereus]
MVYQTRNANFVGQRDPVFVTSLFVFTLTRLFATILSHPIVRPTPTPPFDLFMLYLIHTVVELVFLASFSYNKHTHDTGAPLPPALTFAAHMLNLGVLFILASHSGAGSRFRGCSC